MAKPLPVDVAEIVEDLKQGLLSPRVFNDQDIHQAELERIFNRCWVFVGHESEIPSPGDYVLRYVGEDQFILVRDEHGNLQLLFNNCVHRGSPVCRADRGNTSHFRCPYHGWIYKNTGEWNGAPFRAQAYRKLDTKSWGLAKAPHVDSYQGLIFANLDPGAVPLREYLGDMCWYLDMLFDLNEQGLRAEGDPHRWVIPANWKAGAENFVGDGYHVQHLHRSAEEIGAVPAIERTVTEQYQVAVDGGHGMVANRGFLPPPWGVLGFPPEVTQTFDLGRLDDRQRAFLERGHGVTVATIFPNLSLLIAPGAYDPNGAPPAVFVCLRTWMPKGPGKTEIWNWTMLWNSAPAEFNELSYRTAVASFSPSGLLEQGDTVAWSGTPDIGRSVFARRNMKLNYQLGLDGMSVSANEPDWDAPGVAKTSVLDETNQRLWWLRWTEEMAK